MKNIIEELNSKKVPIIKINESLKVHKGKKRFAKKLALMNDILSAGELPEAYYVKEEIVEANEPLPKYEISKGKEKDDLSV